MSQKWANCAAIMDYIISMITKWLWRLKWTVPAKTKTHDEKLNTKVKSQEIKFNCKISEGHLWPIRVSHKEI